MTRILFFGDLAGTGFGSVTLDLGKALLDAGQDVRFISQNELGQLPEPYESRTYRVNNPDGWQALKAVGIMGLLDGSLWPDGWVPEAGILLGDYFAIREVVMANADTIAAFGSIPVLHYVPIEGVDLPPAWRPLWDVVHPVAMSEFGANQIEAITGKRPPMVYHGVDTTQFRPITPKDPLRLKDAEGEVVKTLRSKADCKRLFGAPDGARWLLRTDRHMPRKLYPSMLRSLAPVLAANPDLYMVIHCRTADEGGIMSDTISKYHPSIARRIVNTGFHDYAGGASRDILTALYNAADVYVSTSAEGFGLTVAEAIACGTPAVGLDYSAVPEVIGPAGLVAPIGGLIDNPYDHFWAVPDERQYGGIVASILDDDILRRRLGDAGPEHVRTNFSWTKAAVAFGDILDMQVAA